MISWIIHTNPNFLTTVLIRDTEERDTKKSGEGQVKTVAEIEVMQLRGLLEPQKTDAQTRQGRVLS